MARLKRQSGGEIHLRAPVIASPEVHPSASGQSLHVLRVGAKGGVEIGLSTLPIATGEMNASTLASAPGAVLESDTAVQRRRGFIKTPKLGEHPTAIDVGRGKSWIDGDGPVVIFESGKELAVALTSVPPIAEGDPVVGLLVRVLQNRVATSNLTSGIRRIRAI